MAAIANISMLQCTFRASGRIKGEFLRGGKYEKDIHFLCGYGACFVGVQ